MSFLSFILKNLFRKKLRFTLTVAGIAVGIAACIIMMGLSEGIRGTLDTAYAKRGIDIVVFEKDQFNLVSSRIDQGLVARLNALDEVERASGVLMDIIKYKKNYLPLYGWPADSPLFDDVKVEGRRPAPGTQEVMLGDIFAQSEEKKIGDQMRIKRKNFDVVGIFKSTVPLEKSAFIIPLNVMQEMDRKDANSVLGINVTLHPGCRNAECVDQMVSKIEVLFPEVTAQTAQLFAEERSRQIVMGEKFASLVLTITVIAVILGLSNTMITSIFERKKLIGFLLAVGWEKTDVLKSLFWETFVMTSLGGALGMAFGYFSMEYIFSTILVNVFTPTIDPAFVGRVAGIVLTTAFIAGLIPSWVIVNLNPVEVIKNE